MISCSYDQYVEIRNVKKQIEEEIIKLSAVWIRHITGSTDNKFLGMYYFQTVCKHVTILKLAPTMESKAIKHRPRYIKIPTLFIFDDRIRTLFLLGDKTVYEQMPRSSCITIAQNMSEWKNSLTKAS